MVAKFGIVMVGLSAVLVLPANAMTGEKCRVVLGLSTQHSPSALRHPWDALPTFPAAGEPIRANHKGILTHALENEGDTGWIYNVPDLLGSYVAEYFPGAAVCQYEGALLLTYRDKGKTIILKPLGVSDAKAAQIIDSIMGKHSGIVFDGIPPKVSNLVSEPSLKKTVDPTNVTYLYDAKEQAELAGGKFKSKRRLVNKFEATYPRYKVYDLRSSPELLDPTFKKQLMVQIVELTKRWAEQKEATVKDKGHVAAEAEALQGTLDQFEALGLEGSAVVVDGKVVAFAYGAKKSKDTFASLYEKADRNYDGAYQKMSKILAEKALQKGFTKLDYQSIPPDETSEQGTTTNTLRDTKMSWRPITVLDWVKIEK